MYTVEKRHLLKLGGTGDPLASQSVEVPLVIDEVSQYLAAWVYTPAGIALGTGSLVIKRNSAIVSTTAFAGNSIVAPLNTYTSGADVELELMHPQTSVARPANSIWTYDTVAGVMVESTDTAKYGGAIIRPMPVTALVTNGDAVRKDLILLWVALVWRNA